jgi:hypothetical protein
MSATPGTLAEKKYYSPLFALWNNSRVRIVLKIIFLIGMGYLAAFGKSIHPSMGIPGSSAVWWLMPMIVGKIAIKNRGTGLLMGATVALCTVPIGLNHTSFYNFGLYGATGLTLDLVAAIPKINIGNFFGALFCGMIAHMVKFGFILGAALTSNVTKHFIIVGTLQSAGLHLAFGAAAGIVGWIPYFIWQRIRKGKTDQLTGLK